MVRLLPHIQCIVKCITDKKLIHAIYIQKNTLLSVFSQNKYKFVHVNSGQRRGETKTVIILSMEEESEVALNALSINRCLQKRLSVIA